MGMQGQIDQHQMEADGEEMDDGEEYGEEEEELQEQQQMDYNPLRGGQMWLSFIKLQI